MFLLSFCAQVAVPAYPSSLHFPLQRNFWFIKVTELLCFLTYFSRQMPCVLFLIRDDQIRLDKRSALHS